MDFSIQRFCTLFDSFSGVFGPLFNDSASHLPGFGLEICARLHALPLSLLLSAIHRPETYLSHFRQP